MKRSRACRLAVAFTGLSVFGLGCTNFYDTVSSRDFRVRDVWSHPDPMTVLKTSEDGDARAKAMRNLKEPKKTGGSDEAQDEAIRILTDAATNDPRSLCRLAAIGTLGRFDDSRTGAALLNAYQSASSFPTDQANSIRCAAMSALGHKQTPAGLALLSQVAATPRPEPPAPASGVRLASKTDEDAIDKILGQYNPDAQAARDARLAAVRALGMTKDQQAIPVLIPLLSERDVALRDRAQEALQNITGHKDVPPSADAWNQKLGAPTVHP
jgi:HEAT repeat protein